MTEFPPTIEELFETFDDLPDIDDRIDFIIDLGRELPGGNPDLQSNENLVDGCMSTVWLNMNVNDPNSPVQIQADSDSQIIKGLLVVLMAFYNQKSAKAIIDGDVSEYLKRLELDQHLSPQRRNGLFAMVKRINALAMQAVGDA